MLLQLIEFYIWTIFTKHRKFVERVGTLLLFSSATIITVSPQLAADAWWAFVGFAMGHLIFVTSALIIRERQYLELNLMFFVLDIYGVAVRIPT